MRPLTSEKVDQIAAALVAAQGQIEGAAKDRANPHYKTRYADLSSVWDACRDALKANSLAVTQLPLPAEPDPQHGYPAGVTMILRTTVMHASGQFLASEMPMGPSLADPQKVGSWLTYARRYSLAAMLGICPEDDDAETAVGRGAFAGQRGGNGNGHDRPATPQRPAPPDSPANRPAPPPKAAPGSLPPRGYTQLVADGAKAYGVKAEDVHRYMLGEAVHAKYTPDPGGLCSLYDVIEIMEGVAVHRKEWAEQTLKHVLKDLKKEAGVPA